MHAVYVRVSSKQQDTRSQEAELKRWAAAQDEQVTWYRDKATGKNFNRPGFQRLLHDVRAGKVDKVVCWRLDRLGRSTRELLGLFEELQALKVGFLSLRDAIDLSTPSGRLMLTVLAGVNAFETEVRAERQAVGIAAVREENGGRCPWGGRKAGTRVKVTVEREALVRRMAKDQEPVAKIARLVGLSRVTVYAVLNKTTVYRTPANAVRNAADAG